MLETKVIETNNRGNLVCMSGQVYSNPTYSKNLHSEIPFKPSSVEMPGGLDNVKNMLREPERECIFLKVAVGPLPIFSGDILLVYTSRNRFSEYQTESVEVEAIEVLDEKNHRKARYNFY